MKVSSLALCALLGLATPAIALDLLAPMAAIADAPITGDYMDDQWFVSLWFESGSLHYQGVDRRTGRTLRLAGATESGSTQRQVYTWRNGGHRYQVSWRPADPDFVRLQVFDPNGRELVNSLLTFIPPSP